jgi:acyl dehydratase
MTARWFDDYRVGDRFTTGSLAISEAAIIDYARQYDPQPFHTDPEAARGSLFGELVASGWQTTALTMRLIVDSGIMGATGTIGVAVDELRWPGPTRPGDILTADLEVLEKRASQSKPDRGVMRVLVTTRNQDDLTVQSYVATLIVRRDPGLGGS